MFRKLFPLYLTIAADVIGWGIVITIFTPLIMGKTGFLAAGVSHEAKSFWIGVLLAIYSVGQFFAAPILGEISDNMGRKKVLILSTFGSFLGFVFSAISVLLSSVWLLFASRLFTGIFAGNQSLAITSIVDLSSQKQKPRQLARVSIVKGIAFAIGPFLGGKLSETKLVSWFDFATPLWFAAIVFFLVFLAIIFLYKETFETRKKERINWLRSLQNIMYLTQDMKLMSFSMITMLGLIAWMLYIFFLPAFLMYFFQFGPGQIGDVNGYLAIWIAIAGFSLQWLMKKKISNRFFYVFSLSLIFIGNLVIYYTHKEWSMWVAVAIAAVGYAVFQPMYSTIASNMASKEIQGKLFGILTSLFAFTIIIAPLIGAWLLAHGPRLPFLNGSIFSLLAVLGFVLFFYRKLKKL